MSRPIRIVFENAWYHVMNRGAAKRNIFHSDLDRQMFLALLDKMHQRYQVEVHAYCLMDNHYHLLIRTPHPNLSQAIKYLNGLYAQRLNAFKKTDGPIFRGRFKSIIVDRDEYLIYLSRYIHMNPVKAGICINPWDYLWSSCKSYLGNLQHKEWLYTHSILEMFKGFNRSKYLNYAAYLMDPVEDSAMEKLLKHFPIFGDDEFFDRLIKKHLHENLNEEIPEQRKIKATQLPSLRRIIEEVEKHQETKNIQALSKGRIIKRELIIYLAITCGQKRLAELGKEFQISRSRVSRIYRDTEDLLTTDMNLKISVEQIKNVLWTVEM